MKGLLRKSWFCKSLLLGLLVWILALCFSVLRGIELWPAATQVVQSRTNAWAHASNTLKMTYLNYCSAAFNLSESECDFISLDWKHQSGKYTVVDFELIYKWHSRDTDNGDGDISIVTHMSVDRLREMREGMCAAWNGPISLALFIRNESMAQATAALNELLKDCPQIEALSILFGTANDWYPINHLRNIALQQTKSEFVFLLDSDFMPSYRMYETLRTDAVQRHLKRADSNDSSAVAFVIPALETPSKWLWLKIGTAKMDASEIGQYFREILTRAERKNHTFANKDFLIAFHRHQCYRCHFLSTDYPKWLHPPTNHFSYAVTNYTNVFEPYIVVKRRGLQRYDARFRGYGWNKVSHRVNLRRCHGFDFKVMYNLSVTALMAKRRQLSANFAGNKSNAQRSHMLGLWRMLNLNGTDATDPSLIPMCGREEAGAIWN